MGTILCNASFCIHQFPDYPTRMQSRNSYPAYRLKRNPARLTFFERLNGDIYSEAARSAVFVSTGEHAGNQFAHMGELVSRGSLFRGEIAECQ